MGIEIKDALVILPEGAEDVIRGDIALYRERPNNGNRRQAGGIYGG